MTNGEAAAILESEAEYLYSQDEPYNRQAFKMAIEALLERKTGKWVLHQCQFDGGWDINCSVCGEGDNGFFARGREDAEYKLKHHYLMDEKRRKGMRYCNYCGAKMEVEE